eukprot:COSAG02_NODE_5_length_66751_cov_63.939148_36_plen_144_part_00
MSLGCNETVQLRQMGFWGAYNLGRQLFPCAQAFLPFRLLSIFCSRWLTFLLWTGRHCRWWNVKASARPASTRHRRCRGCLRGTVCLVLHLRDAVTRSKHVETHLIVVPVQMITCVLTLTTLFNALRFGLSRWRQHTYTSALDA